MSINNIALHCSLKYMKSQINDDIYNDCTSIELKDFQSSVLGVL